MDLGSATWCTYTWLTKVVIGGIWISGTPSSPAPSRASWAWPDESVPRRSLHNPPAKGSAPRCWIHSRGQAIINVERSQTTCTVPSPRERTAPCSPLAGQFKTGLEGQRTPRGHAGVRHPCDGLSAIGVGRLSYWRVARSADAAAGPLVASGRVTCQTLANEL